MPQFKTAFAQIAATTNDTLPPPQAPEVHDLPLVEFPSADTTDKLLAIHLTGDGGVGVTDKGIAKALADSGISTVILNAQKYFWKVKTPEVASQALTRILGHYLNAWNKQQAILIGYSLGADALPFMVNRLPENLKARIKLVALISPSHTSDFEVHLINIIGGSASGKSAPVLPELAKMKGMNIIIFQGTNEDDSIVKELPPDLARVVELTGGHRIKSNFTPITDKIVREARK
jgi:type IV secretory pathway VirJ component